MNCINIGEIMIISSDDLNDMLYSKNKNLMRSRCSRQPQSSKRWLTAETVFCHVGLLDSRLQTAGAKDSGYIEKKYLNMRWCSWIDPTV